MRYSFKRLSRDSSEFPEIIPAARGVVPQSQLNSALAKLCSLPVTDPGQAPSRIPDDRIRRIACLLCSMDAVQKRVGRSCWSYRPRTYTILRHVGGLALMDNFAEKGYTDFWHPYSDRTLPDFVQDPWMRQHHTRGDSLADSSDVRKSIATLFDKHTPQRMGLAGDMSFSTKRWLADTSSTIALPQSFRFPGNAFFNNSSSNELYECPPGSEAFYHSVAEDFSFADIPPPPQVAELPGDTPRPSPPLEPVELLADTTWYRPLHQL